MPFGMGPVGWAYASPYAYPYAAAPYSAWLWCGVAGEEAGGAAGDVGAAGAGLHLTGTRGGKTTN
jgi:hypothetical protein